MELCTADRSTAVATDEFPGGDLTPFPLITAEDSHPFDLHYATPEIQSHRSPDSDHHQQQPPPQKLRPVRSNAKPAGDSSESPANPHSSSQILGSGAFSDGLMKLDFADLGFLSHQEQRTVSQFGDQEDERVLFKTIGCSDSLTPQSAESNGGDFAENGCASGEIPAAPSQVKLEEMDAEDANLIFENDSGWLDLVRPSNHDLMALLSLVFTTNSEKIWNDSSGASALITTNRVSSQKRRFSSQIAQLRRFGNLKSLFDEEDNLLSTDADDSPEDTKGSMTRKRKRKTASMLAHLMEKLLMKVMKKQELMHKQLIQTIETREKERIIREEAWMRQQLERAKRDEEARAEDRSRNLALISFIQKTLGQEIQIPPDLSFSGGVPRCEADSKKDTKTELGYKRWTTSEVQALVTLRTALDEKFHGESPKGLLWEEISAGLLNNGYSRTARQCREKWENINKYFRRSICSGEKRPNTPYYQELDTLYRTGVVSSENDPNSCIKDAAKD